MDWLLNHREQLLAFPENDSFFLKPLADIAAIKGPFSRSTPFQAHYARMLTLLKSKALSTADKETIVVCFALAMSKFAIDYQKVTLELRISDSRLGMYNALILIYDGIPNHPTTEYPIYLTATCLAAKGKIGFDFYCWHILGAFPDSLAINA